MNDRRTFLGIAGLTGAGLLLFGRSTNASANFTVNYSAAEWRKRLGAERYYILREAGTERPFTSALLNEHRHGTFSCAGCAKPLFSSTTKFESGTGWPSFYESIPGAVATKVDYKLIAPRTEYHCRRCDGHQGHVFPDGPQPTGQRYCNNGVALKFMPT